MLSAVTLQCVEQQGPLVLTLVKGAPVTVEPDDSPLSDTLADRVSDWADIWLATFDPWDPLQSGFASEVMEIAHIQEGRAIAKAVAGELGVPVTLVHPALKTPEMFD